MFSTCFGSHCWLRHCLQFFFLPLAFRIIKKKTWKNVSWFLCTRAIYRDSDQRQRVNIYLKICEVYRLLKKLIKIFLNKTKEDTNTEQPVFSGIYLSCVFSCETWKFASSSPWISNNNFLSVSYEPSHLAKKDFGFFLILAQWYIMGAIGSNRL